MGKREECKYYVDHYQAATTHHMKKKEEGSPCKHRFSRNPTRGVWQLAVPSWEKQFCLEIGLFKWEDFLEAKKYSQYYYATSKIQNWDNSAAEQAFNHAKNRFFARFRGGLQPHPDNDDDQSMMDPNLYIDEINWEDDEQMDPDLLEELESAKLSKDCDHVPDPDPIQIQDIKPTGWDVDIEQLSQSNVLTGLIVGS